MRNLRKSELWFENRLSSLGVCRLDMGGDSGGSAPQPDPNVGKAMLETAAISKEALAFYKDTVYPQLMQEYEDYKPINKEMAQLSLESAKTNQALATDYQNYMTEVARPIEKSMAAEAMDYAGPGRMEASAARAEQDTADSFDKQASMSARANERAGVNPNSGNAQALQAESGLAEAAATAGAKTLARERTEALGWAKKADMANMFRGLASNQATSTQIATSQAGQTAGLASAPMANLRANASTMGQGYTTAVQGQQASANIGLGMYQAQMQGYQAEQNANASSSSGMGSLVGSLGSAAMYAWSDRSLKRDISPIGVTEGGHRVYSYKYLWDDAVQIGVMADEVSHVPGAVISVGGFSAVDYSRIH